MTKTSEYRGRYATMAMPHGCLYLNNSGSRWVTQDMRFVLVMSDGTKRVRIADYYESFGNFALTCYRVKGKQFAGLAKSHDGLETRDDKATGQDALPHIFHANQEALARSK